MCADKTLISKISPPAPSRFFQRTRLFRLLDDGRDRPAVWISGPAGSGKTTLASSYLAARNLPGLWYQIDARDTDPATFFYYMNFAVRQACPQKRISLPLLTPEYLPGLEAFALRYFETVYQYLGTPMAIVFDNYQTLPKDSPLHGVILGAVSVAPAGVTVMPVSREGPPPAFSRLLANRKLAHFGWDRMQLTPAETSGIAKLQTEEYLSEETVQHIHKATGGWAAGLMLMLARSDVRDIDWRCVGELSRQEIFDYFGKEVFEKAAPKIQEFLLRAAFLPHMTVGMASDLTGHARAGEVLSGLNRRNQFTERRLQKRLSYQFHPLFQEFLLSRAMATYDGEEIADLRRRAAALLEDAGDLEAAAALLQAAGAWEALAGLILSHARPLTDQGRFLPLLGWIEALPEEMVRGSEWLLFWRGFCRSRMVPGEDRASLLRAYELFKAKSEPVGVAMSWCALEYACFVEGSDYAPLDFLIDEAFEYLPGIEGKLPPDLSAMLGFHIFSALVMRQPQHPQMERYAGQVDRLLEQIPDLSQRLLKGSRLVIFRCLQGHIRKAAPVVAVLGPLVEKSSVPPFSKLVWLCAEAGYALVTGDIDHCIQIVAEGEEIIRRTGIRITEATLLYTGAVAMLGRWEFKKADEYLDRMEKAIFPGSFYEYALCRNQRAISLALQGRIVLAMEAARAALEMALRSGSPLIEVFIRFCVAQLHADSGAYPAAEAELDRAGKLGRTLRSPSAEYLRLVCCAHLQFRVGDEAAGMELLKQGLARGRENGYVHALPLNDRHDVMTDLYVRALETDVETDYVREVVSRRRLVPKAPPVHLENWPWPLKIFTLGRFSIQGNGDTAEKTGAAARNKPMEMLKAVIALGGRNVDIERLSDVLWPDVEGDKAYHACATTLHRLRRFLGGDGLVQIQAGRLTLNPAACWVDCWAFERLLTNAREASMVEKAEKEIGFLEKAVVLYKGAFLADAQSASWAVSRRERLRSKFLQTVNRIGTLFSSAEQWEAAAEYYRRSLDVDDLSEETYLHLLKCLDHLDKKNEAVAVYERCRKTLHAAFGASPSPDIQAVFNALMGGR